MIGPALDGLEPHPRRRVPQAGARALRHAEGMSRWQLRGTYYGEGTPSPSDLETPDGRRRMREVIQELLTVADSNNAPAEMLSRMRDDLVLLQE